MIPDDMKKMDPEKGDAGGLPNRREFLRAVGRWFIIGVGGIMASVFVKRRQVSLGRQSCSNQGICSTCRYSRSCGLPQAASRRRALEKAKGYETARGK